MPKNTFISLIAALGGSILGGLITLLLSFHLLHTLYADPPSDFFSGREFNLMIGVIFCFVAPFPVCVGFLVPLAAIEKNRIESRSLKELLVRYTPLIALPAGLLLLPLLCGDFTDESDRYFTMTMLFTFAGTSFSALWFFLYRLKHRS